MDASKPAALLIIPAQLEITVERFETGVSITQTGGQEGEQSIWVAGDANLDLLIAALQKAGENT